jgi:hypothetical protein
MIQMIQIPDVRLIRVLFIDHGIAVCDLDCRINLFAYI